jgi:hypothetical protein
MNATLFKPSLDARGICAVAFPCKANIPHLAPAISKPVEKGVNGKWSTANGRKKFPFAIDH